MQYSESHNKEQRRGPVMRRTGMSRTHSEQGTSVHMRVCVCVCVYVLSRVQLFIIPWTTARQAPLSMGFSMQEYWSGLPFPSPGDLPDPRIELRCPALQVDSLPSEPPGKPPRTSLSYVYCSSGEIPLNSLSRSVLYLHCQHCSLREA